ncbi:MAG: transcriptional repressor [Firmicutes bacterium]|jgi:Fur family peroxide stress response transcriptional regulator|nr:transcriptional repressor [Bacillota bacterium]
MTKKPDSKQKKESEEGHMSRTVISNTLRDAGIRPTPQRVAIYEMLRGTTSHPKAETIHEAVKCDFPSLSLNTVYDTLQTFDEAGLIRKLAMKENISRYDGNPAPHGHFVCARCGRVQDLRPSVDAELERINLMLKDKIDGRIIDCDYRFYGYCAECINKAVWPDS